MEDVSELFKRHFNLLHKGTTVVKTVEDRKEVRNKERKATRDTLALLRRNIDANLSPVNSPTPIKKQLPNNVKSETLRKEKEEYHQATSNIKCIGSSRLELLRKWKDEKAKQKSQEKAKAKPLFKVYHVSDSIVDISNANRFIKGKPFASGSESKSQFAPPNHKFKPPKGIKPLDHCYHSKSPSVSSKCTVLKNVRKGISVETPSVAHYNKSTSVENTKAQKQKVTRSAKAVKRNSNLLFHSKSTSSTCKTPLNEAKKDVLIKNHSEESVHDNISSVKNKKEKQKVTKSPKAGLLGRNNCIKSLGKDILIKNQSEESIHDNISSVKNNKEENQKATKSPKTISVERKNSIKSLGDNSCSKSASRTITPLKRATNDILIKDSSTESVCDILTLAKNKGENQRVTRRTKCAPIEKNKKIDCSNLSASTDCAADNNQNNTMLHNGSQNEISPPPVYLSPFVTISRGKHSAKKEFKIRTSMGNKDIDKTCTETVDMTKILTAHTSSKAGAAYFKRKLDIEIKRINEICEVWKKFQKDQELPENAHSSIDVAIGQSKLLISKKFQQFSRLISQCETENYETKPVTCEDLHGFWDVIYMQVEDLDKRFDYLQKLKDNNWEEILPQSKKISVKKLRGRPKKAEPKSKLAQMIREARKKQKESPSEDALLSVNEVKTPIKEKDIQATNSSNQKSLRISTLNKEKHSRCSSSPGLMMMKISQSIKKGDGLTPARSILKTDVYRSTGKKSVVFKEDVLDDVKPLIKAKLFQEGKANNEENIRVDPTFISKEEILNEQDKENAFNNLISFSPIPLTPRRSSRISKLKL